MPSGIEEKNSLISCNAFLTLPLIYNTSFGFIQYYYL